MPPSARSGDLVLHDAPHCHAAMHLTGKTFVPVAHAPVPLAILTGCPTVSIGGRPAARASDVSAGCAPAGCLPKPGGAIQRGSSTVTIGGLPAARVGDAVTFTACGGPIPCLTGKVLGPGTPTVTIG